MLRNTCPSPLFRSVATLLALVLTTACAVPRPAATPIAATPVAGDARDLSGNWEKNYQISDDFNTRYNLYIADVRRVIARLNQGDIEALPQLRGRGLNVDAINGLARFVEELTRMPVLTIEQDAGAISIERDTDFTLRCAWSEEQYSRSSNAFGGDLCGWTGERLQFLMELAGGLNITHQFTLSPDATMLNVTTLVSSDDVGIPIVISNYYRRFTPSGEDYNCLLTLTRNTVCNQRGEPR